MKKIGDHQKILIALIPSYFTWILACYIMSCLWYYFTYSLQSDDGWLFTEVDQDASTSDQFWLSVYFVTQTITKTGYGDLLPTTTIEFLLTIILTHVGALFYFSIFSKIDLRFKKDEN